MEGFKEFLGKTLDAAIGEACSYFNASREKLEIEIIEDAKSGIFGIVGARKAKVRARRAALREAVENALGRGSRADDGRKGDLPGEARADERKADERPSRQPRAERQDRAEPQTREDGEAQTADASRGEAAQPREATGQPRREERGARPGRKAAAARAESPLPSRQEDERQEADDETAAGAAPQTAPQAARAARANARARGERARHEERAAVREQAREARRQPPDDDLDEAEEGLPRRAVEELDQERLTLLARECVSRLVRPMVDGMEDEPEVCIADGRVRVAVDCGEDSGLLIGREGQTLAALQYLASRIVSRGMDAAVRVQLDAGRYRQRQEEKLQEMALTLAAKVRQSGRSYSTRPLSSYHRRIIHVCLQDMEDILTRSSGDGPLKRVVIMRRRPEKGQERTGARRGQPARPAPESPLTASPALSDAPPSPAEQLPTPDMAAPRSPAPENVVIAASGAEEQPAPTATGEEPREQDKA